MPFNSLSFLVFIVVFLILYYIPRNKWQLSILLIGSCIFYGVLNFGYFLLLSALTFFVFYFGKIFSIPSFKRKHFIFSFIIIVLVIIYLFFKYYHFIYNHLSPILFQSSFSYFSYWFPIPSAIIYPLGLSFFVFSALSYIIDLKRGVIPPEKDFMVFANYFLFFPKISQGPIERAGRLLPSFREVHQFDYFQVANGLKLIAWGLFKKVVIADRIAVIVNTIYNNPDSYNGLYFMVATLFFAFQIYADFSGYTDMAIGIAKMLGYELTQNFNKPYFSKSIREFWTRWHISFSTWLRDYLFLPVAFKLSDGWKKDKIFGIQTEKIIYALAITFTFFICGIWHGEGLNFVVWGLLFGVALSLSRLFKKSLRKNKILRPKRSNKIIKFFQWFLTFSFVCFAWIFFRSNTIQEAFLIIKKIIQTPYTLPQGQLSLGYVLSIFRGFGVTQHEFIIAILSITFLLFVDYFRKNREITATINNLPAFFRWIVYYFILIMILFFGAFNSTQDFIYAKF